MTKGSFVYCSEKFPCQLCGAKKDCRHTTDGLYLCKNLHATDDYRSPPGWSSRGNTDPSSGVGELFGLWVNDLTDQEISRDERRAAALERAQAAKSKDHVKKERAAAKAKASTVRYTPPKPGARTFTTIQYITEHQQPLSDLPERAAQLAARLGLPYDSAPALSALQVLYPSWIANEPQNNLSGFLTPFRDGRGDVIGYTIRELNGAKTTRGTTGIIIPEGFLEMRLGAGAPTEAPSPILLVEGASDAACLHLMQISTVGRPNNMAGSAHLIELIHHSGQAKIPPARPIIVLGENDRKEDTGLWPGRAGAEKVAKDLVQEFGADLQILVAFPPPGCKDVREWVKQEAAKMAPGAADDPAAWFALGTKFLEMILAGATRCQSPSSKGGPVKDKARTQATIDKIFGAPPDLRSIEAQMLELFGPPEYGPKKSEAAPAPSELPTPRSKSYSKEPPSYQPLCPHNRNVLLRSKTLRCMKVVTVSCKSPSCYVCSVAMKIWWIASISHHMSAYAAKHGINSRLYWFLCPDGKQSAAWHAIYSNIKHHSGDYFGVDPNGDGMVICCSTVLPASVQARGPEGWEEIPPDEAARRFSGIIQALPLINYNPVTHTRAWNLLRDDYSKKVNLYERVCKISPNTTRVIEYLQATGVPYKYDVTGIFFKKLSVTFAFGRVENMADVLHLIAEMEAGGPVPKTVPFRGKRFDWAGNEVISEDHGEEDEWATTPQDQQAPQDYLHEELLI